MGWQQVEELFVERGFIGNFIDNIIGLEGTQVESSNIFNTDLDFDVISEGLSVRQELEEFVKSLLIKLDELLVLLVLN